MNLGNSFFNARKKKGLSQEEVAEKLGVSRQTISKWELGETIPDIYQSKKLTNLYNLSLDELIEFDIDVKEFQEVIDKTSDKVSDKVNWTKVWSKKYPILSTYRNEVKIEKQNKISIEIFWYLYFFCVSTSLSNSSIIDCKVIVFIVCFIESSILLYGDCNT